MTRRHWIGLWAAALLGACSPTVKVEAPDKPIRIDLNVNITQEVRVKVERDLEDVFANNPELFALPGVGAGAGAAAGGQRR